MFVPLPKPGAGLFVRVAGMAAALAAVLLVALPEAGLGQPAIRLPAVGAPEPAAEDPYGIYLPTDRTLSRAMDRARKSLSDREYNEALTFLQRVLDRDEDVFFDDGSEASSRLGLKATARELLAKLPNRGRETYDLLYATAARRQLEAAAVAGDRDTLASLVRRFGLTTPGREATLVFAQMEFDRGHPLAAAHLYQQLADDEQAAAQFEPQLSLLAAISWSAAGEGNRAAEALRSVARRFPDAEVEVAGNKQKLPAASESDGELNAWLVKAVGVQQHAGPLDQEWLTQRGDVYRNAQHRGGPPHLSARWKARVVNDPRLETYLASRGRQFDQHGIVVIPAARPISVGDVILMKTPQNVVAVDWQSGKRIWETREDESASREQLLADSVNGGDRDELPMTSTPLEQRIWDDTLSSSLSSDGERVFVIGGTSEPARDDNAGWQQVGPAMGVPIDATVVPTNRLTAYELPTEGKLAWEIDGSNTTGDLAGTFFLGPPLAVDDALYVLAEIRSAVYLLALEPQSGRLLWRQQLAGLEQSISLDPQRRLNASTPSYADGVLVCPTSAGMVVAVDIVGREFAWVYRYPRRTEGGVALRPGLQVRADGPTARDNDRWLDGSAVIADGRVFLTPPESAELHCLDLATGKVLWHRPRAESIFIAGVDHGNVLLVGREAVFAVKASDGTPAWTPERRELPDGVHPTGLGYLSEGRYYLPLTSGQVAAIDVVVGAFGVVGAISGTSETPGEMVLGNLICHRGSILSQSALSLDKYEQTNVLRQRAENALAQNPQDAGAIRDLAEMRRLVGDLPEAIRMLKQAFAIDSADPLTRDMLADCLLAALSADYDAHRDDLPLLRQIIHRPEQQLELQRIDAQGLQASGRRLESFVAYLRLADDVGPELLPLAVEKDRNVRSDVWIRARLNELWADAPSDERAAMSREIATRKHDWGDAPTAGQLRRYLAIFDGLPGSDALRLQFVLRLLERRELLDAEIEILKLQQSNDADYQTAAAFVTAKWLVASDRLDEARRLAATIANRSLPASIASDASLRQSLEGWRAELASVPATDSAWPRGRAHAEDMPTAPTMRREGTRRAQAEFQQGLRKLRVEQVSRPGFGTANWFIAQDCSQIVGRNDVGNDIFRLTSERGENSIQRFPGNGEYVQAGQLGDLLYVTLGGRVVALDTREIGDDGEGDVLWQAYPGGRLPMIPLRAGGRGRARTFYHANWSERKRVQGPIGLLLGGLGPVTPGGVVVQEQQRVRCVDPVSGETLWSRTDIPAGCELFGDDELLLAASLDEDKVYVVNMADGKLVGRRDLPDAPWLLTAGRNVARIADEQTDRGPRKELRVVDVMSGNEVFHADYESTVRMTTIEPNFVAVVSPPDKAELAQFIVRNTLPVPAVDRPPQGRFQLIDVRTGKTTIDQRLSLAIAPRSLYVLPSGDTLFVGISGEGRQQAARSGWQDAPMIEGQVYAFDMTSGRAIWPGPAVVQRRGMVLSQPTDLPVLLFVDRAAKGENGSSTQMRLLCLDKQTGATVYRNDELPDSNGNQFRARATQNDPRSITMEMSARTVKLTFDDRPRPPEPPLNDLVEAPRKSSGNGFWNLGQRMSNAIQGVIRKPRGNEPRPEAQAPTGDNDEVQLPSDD